jgi:hypothetical protein
VLRSSFRVIGDDYVSLVPREVSEEYTSVLRRTGGQPSEGKDFSSRVGLVFGEEAAVFLGGELIDLDSVSVRALTGEAEWTKPGCLPTDVPLGLASSFERAGPALRRRICSLGQAAFGPLVRRAVSLGIPPFLPRFVGGLGLPTAHPTREWRRWPRHARAVRWAISGVIQGVLPVSRLSAFSSVWTDPPGNSAAAAWADEILERQVLEHGFAKAGTTEMAIPYVEYRKRLVSFLREGEELAFGISTEKDSHPSLHLVGVRLRSRVSEILSHLPAGRLSDPVENMEAGLERVRKSLVEDFCIRFPASVGVFAPVDRVDLFPGSGVR